MNPDIYGRQQEVRKPLPDRHRQWAFSLPFFNHRMRNFTAKYKWCMIDNEPDWNDFHPIGYRPNRKPIHRRPYMWVFTVPRDTCEHEQDVRGDRLLEEATVGAGGGGVSFAG